MNSYFRLFSAIAVVGLLWASCTERRTASDPVPDGDTVEVVIKGDEKGGKQGEPEIIEVPDTIDLLKK